MKKVFVAFSSITIILIISYALCPKPDISEFIPYSSAYFDNEGQLLRITLASDDRYRLPETLNNISPELINATILYEDQNYYDHTGVDYFSLLRAFWVTYISAERRVGASTIPMQVARLRWGLSSHTLYGKILQIFRAIQLSRHYTKNEILELYLNIAPYGRNIEGISAASLIYFNKKPSQLSLPEALTLAVIPQNPNKRNPTTVKGYEELLTARNNLFTRWLEYYPKDKDKYNYLNLVLKIRSPEELPFNAPHFIQYISNKKSNWDSGYIDTTLDMSKQKQVETIVKNYTDLKSTSGINNASALVINYKTMELQAMIGSSNFYDEKLHGQVNGVTAKRSPGSTLKPFVYALAIDDGLIHPMSLMKDSPRRFGGFTPENYDKQFLGPISAKKALIESRNVPAVTLQSKLKSKSFYHFLKSAGVTKLKSKQHYGLSLSLGGGEVSMIELAQLYAALANHGQLRPINDYESTVSINSNQILSAESSFMVLDMLKTNPSPIFQNQFTDISQVNEVAWKTGTSWAFRDAWAIGISGPHLVLVWVGNFNGSGNDAFIGRTAAGPLLFSIFNAINQNNGWKVSDIFKDKKLNLKKLKVCSSTGDLNEKNCPALTETWFIPGVSPIKISNVYRSIPIDKKTGLRACYHNPSTSELKVYEYWPSDFLHIFNQAGISFKTPPKYLKNCKLNSKSTTGQNPVITSPQGSLKYIITPNSYDSNNIPLKAIVDPDATTLYWFVDNAYVGQAKNGEVILWQAKQGQYKVRVVDDLGRGASKRFRVELGI